MLLCSGIPSFYLCFTFRNLSLWQYLLILAVFVWLFPEIISGQTWGFESCPKPSSLSCPYADLYLDLLKYPEVSGCLNNFPLAIWNSELIWSLSRKTPVIYALSTNSSILVIGKTKKAVLSGRHEHLDAASLSRWDVEQESVNMTISHIMEGWYGQLDEQEPLTHTLS